MALMPPTTLLIVKVHSSVVAKHAALVPTLAGVTAIKRIAKTTALLVHAITGTLLATMTFCPLSSIRESLWLTLKVTFPTLQQTL